MPIDAMQLRAVLAPSLDAAHCGSNVPPRGIGLHRPA